MSTAMFFFGWNMIVLETWPMAKLFKLFGMTNIYIVGKNKPFKLFFQGPGRLSEVLETGLTVKY